MARSALSPVPSSSALTMASWKSGVVLLERSYALQRDSQI
jgi:hypothetical protein